MSSNEENNKLKQDTEKDLQQTKDLLLRLNADFDNYKKRIAKEKISWIDNAQADLLLDLLPIIDNFDRAFSGYKKGENKDLDKYIEGFELIYKSFIKFLEDHGVSEIKEEKVFNPEFHEGIAQIESPNNKSGEIVSVAQKGYMFKDKVLRPAKVAVAK